MIMNVAGLLAAAVLLVALVALEVRRVGPENARATPSGLAARLLSRRAVAVMWAVYLLLFLPRVIGLLA
ncbi:MAG: hypothetical protein HOQ04_06085 [Pseudarthrobacter sp.]|nr:hypothetical protein [Pseudarthrobacter sp.]